MSWPSLDPPGGRVRSGSPSPRHWAVLGAVAVVALALLAALVVPVMLFAGGSMLNESGGSCPGAAGGAAAQPPASGSARHSIPASYLAWFQSAGKKYGVPWAVLAGIGEVESDDGRSTLPGVHSGANAFGAAGPMQIGIGGAAGNTWGGAPVHPASEQVAGVATDADGDGIASVYDPADAIAGAAKYLLAHGVLTNVDNAIFAYNHLESYVQAVTTLASAYTSGGYTVTPVTLDAAPECLPGVAAARSGAAATAIAYAEQQIGKPYLWGGTGPDAFDCSGLVMMAYRAAGIDIPRTSQQQWAWGPQVPASQVQAGDLVFFAGSDGTTASPGHVGLVIGTGLMIEAYATGYPIRIAHFGSSGAAAGDGNPVGFTQPWGHRGVIVAAGPPAG